MDVESLHTRRRLLPLRLSSEACDMMRRAEMKDLTLPEDLIWTVPITPLEEQVPQPTRAPPQRIPILKYVSPRTRLVSPSSP